MITIMIKTLFFDIGNVLLFVDPKRLYRQIADVCDLNLETVYEAIQTSEIQLRYEKGEITTEEVCTFFSRLSQKEIPKDHIFQALTEIFSPNESIIPLIKTLKKQNIALILLSNTCEMHFQFIQKNFPIITSFDQFILSYEVNARKPERAIFEAAISASGHAPAECFYIDDIPEYVLAARTLGIDAEPYKDTPTLKVHLKKRGVAA